MKHTLTDLSQLSKAMFKSAPKADEVKPAPPKAKPHDDGEDALAYFSRPVAGVKAAQNAPTCAPAADGADAQAEALRRDVAALRAQLRDSEAARTEAESKAADLEREREKLADALAYPLKKRAALLKVAEGRAARKEVERLKGECGRLQGEARKAALAATGAADAKVEPTVVPAAERPTRGIVAPLAAFGETFPGEVREMVLSALSEARDAAHQSTRERRAAILDAVLEMRRRKRTRVFAGDLRRSRTAKRRVSGRANKPTGELERRRAELKQAMKDCGYYTDPKAIERLGFKLISGRTHWKLEYGNVRMPIAKTPSDYRANLNMATDLANRCF